MAARESERSRVSRRSDRSQSRLRLRQKTWMRSFSHRGPTPTETSCSRPSLPEFLLLLPIAVDRALSSDRAKTVSWPVILQVLFHASKCLIRNPAQVAAMLCPPRGTMSLSRPMPAMSEDFETGVLLARKFACGPRAGFAPAPRPRMKDKQWLYKIVGTVPEQREPFE